MHTLRANGAFMEKTNPHLHRPDQCLSVESSGLDQKTNGHSRNAANRRLPVFPVYERLRYAFQWRYKTLLHIGHNAIAHMQLLLSQKEFFVDCGLSFERQRDKRWIPRERTHVRWLGTKTLLKKYPWAGPVEQMLFLEGFDQGEAFALSTRDKPESLTSGAIISK